MGTGRPEVGAQPQQWAPSAPAQEVQQGQYYYGGQGADPGYYGPPGGQQQYSAPSPSPPPWSGQGYPDGGQGGAFAQQGGPPPFPQHQRPPSPQQQPQQQSPAFFVQTPTGFTQGQPWTTGIFECFNDPASCIITVLAPCVTYGQIAEILDQGTSTCFGGALLYFVIQWCLGVPCCLSYTARSKLRFKYGLPEDPLNDFCTHFWCEWCALCQEYRELKNRGLDPALGWVGANIKPVMVAPGQPTMAR